MSNIRNKRVPRERDGYYHIPSLPVTLSSTRSFFVVLESYFIAVLYVGHHISYSGYLVNRM